MNRDSSLSGQGRNKSKEKSRHSWLFEANTQRAPCYGRVDRAKQQPLWTTLKTKNPFCASINFLLKKNEVKHGNEISDVIIWLAFELGIECAIVNNQSYLSLCVKGNRLDHNGTKTFATHSREIRI